MLRCQATFIWDAPSYFCRKERAYEIPNCRESSMWGLYPSVSFSPTIKFSSL